MALADDILTSINASLTANLSWLDATYGKVQKLQRVGADGKVVRYPGIYIGGETHDYISLLPDQTIGRNYSYFEIDEVVDYENIDRNIRANFKFKLVVWFYWPDLYADHEDRSIEEVKAQVLNVLTAAPYSRSVAVYQIREDAPGIYAGYTHQEIDRQFLMRPYGGFSIEGEVYGAAACALEMAVPTIPVNLFGLLPFNFSTVKQRFPLYKWLGKNVSCQVWDLGAGSDSLVPLTGLTEDIVDEMPLPGSCMISKNSVSGAPQILGIIPEPDEDGLYHAFTHSFTVYNYAVILFTEI